MAPHYLWSGQRSCFDTRGTRTACSDPLGAVQEAASRPGLPWPAPRFHVRGDTVLDAATGLTWPRRAAVLDFAFDWSESLAAVVRLNAEGLAGHRDWRIPNRRELRSLIDHAAARPALPPDHPFEQVAQTWYWTSTTAAMAPAHAWRVHLAGGRMFYGRKTDPAMLWPVRGASAVLPATGQTRCFNTSGKEVPCAKAVMQDGALRAGVPWPEPRFKTRENSVLDRLTGLIWTQDANIADGVVDWGRALGLTTALRTREDAPWRLPSINELESLVDAAHHSPALQGGHPFASVPEAVWSSTTSGYEPDWAYCLYLNKGAVGVGFKLLPEFGVWAVREAE